VLANFGNGGEIVENRRIFLCRLAEMRKVLAQWPWIENLIGERTADL
jgi:hypothetical protein